jgi:hypothetical protein
MDAGSRSAVVLDVWMLMVMMRKSGSQFFVIRVGLRIVSANCLFVPENSIVVVEKSGF